MLKPITFKSPIIKVLLGFVAHHRQTVMFAEITIELSQPIDSTTLDINLNQLFTTETSLVVPPELSAQALADLLIACTIVLQQQGGHPIFISGQAEPLNQPNSFCLSIPYFHAPSAIDALTWSVHALNSLISEPVMNWALLQEAYQTLLVKLKRVAAGSFTGVNAFHFFNAAYANNIPYLHLVDKIYQFGYGINSRWLNSSITDTTPALAVALAKDKLFCAQLLRATGFPIPLQSIATNVDTALQMAEKMGYPVVIKPIALDKGVGVAAGLLNADAVKRAFMEAAKNSQRIMVEKHIDGDDYRISVIDGVVERVTRRTVAHIIGDGISSVQQLLDKTNAEPRRNSGKQQTLLPIKITEETAFLLAEQDLSFAAIPKIGQFVRLARICNVAVGGEPSIVDLSLVHPDNLRLAIRVAHYLGLDVAGIDFLSPDISQAWHQVNCGICEVNAQPQISGNSDTVKGQRYSAILSKLLNNADGRIPITAIVGHQDTIEKIAGLLHKIMCQSGVMTGLTTSQGCWIGDEQVAWKNLGAFAGERLLLTDKTVETAIIPLTFKQILNGGTIFDVCDIAILMNTQLENISLNEPYSPAALANLNISVLQRARKAVILNADDINCMVQRQFLTHQEIVLVSTNATQTEVLAHIEKGGRAVWLDTRYNQTFICFYHQKIETMPLIINSDFSGADIVFTVASAWMLGIPLTTIYAFIYS